jgi:hypothetical protein
MRGALVLAALGLAVACSNDDNTGPAAAAGTSGSGGKPSGTGGSAGEDGNAGGSAGDAGANSGGAVCKRGIAAGTTPLSGFSPGVGWYNNWSMSGAGSLEFVPMMWGKLHVNKPLPTGAKYLLTFYEPNVQAQSNLTAQAAADLWPSVEAAAQAAGVPIASPTVNFCDPASDCNETSPYQYLKDFFAACSGCQVDYVAVHWHNCDLASLRDYLEPGGSLEGFEQFGKPIWLTEFSCDASASVADQEAYMRAAVPYLEQNPHVYRYAWFSDDPIPNAKLMNNDGSPNALGDVYRTLPGACEP